MKVSPNFSEVEVKEIEDGEHIAQIFSAESQETTYLGITTTNIKWVLKLIGENEKAKGFSIQYLTPIHGKFAWKLDMFLKIINPKYAGGEFDTQDFITKKVKIITAKIPHKNGKSYAQIQKVMPYEQSGSFSDSAETDILSPDFSFPS